MTEEQSASAWGSIAARFASLPEYVPAARDIERALATLIESAWFARATGPGPRTPMTGELLSADDPRVAEIGRALRGTYLKQAEPAFLDSPDGQRAILHQAIERYNDCIRWIVPWVRRHIDLGGVDLVEIGCGTGSSACAFAHACRSIAACDIEAKSIDAAQERARILGMGNVSFACAPAGEVLRRWRVEHGRGVGAILLYALIEHTTYAERMEILRQCWDALEPGGYLIVGDTPNRLTYSDTHTSFLPFFDALPHAEAIDYAPRSPRKDFIESLAGRGAHRFANAEEALIRWGRGISYHDFELALGPIWDCVVGDGFDPEIIDVKPLVLEEVLLAIWMEREAKQVPPAFYRRSIDVILRKPG